MPIFGVSGLRDIGSFVKVVNGINPTNSGAQTINGPAIDRMQSPGKMFQSAVLKVSAGAAAGGPSALTVGGKLQDSGDGQAGWNDIAGAAITQLSAENTDEQVKVDLSGARRYIRTVVPVQFTGGSSPTLPVAAEVLLGGSTELPV